MAGFKVEGLTELQADMRRICECPADVKAEILTSMAAVAAEEQRKTAREMGVYDTESTGKHLADSVKVGKPKMTEDGGSVSVTFSGTRKDKRHPKGARQAEIAFINNYGKKGQPARPFVRTANTRAEERIQKAGQAAWDRWAAQKQ